MSHFEEIERTELFDFAIKMCQADSRVTSGSIVGSFALNKQDEWSDLDLSFGISKGFEIQKVLDEWTEILTEKYKVIHHFDVPRSSAIYRVHLFSNGIELDLSAVPENEFGPKGSSFKLLFGKAVKNSKKNSFDLQNNIGWCWHHVLHANSSLKRGKLWRTEFWLARLRELLINLKCYRSGLPSLHGRGADSLPLKELDILNSILIKSIEKSELQRVLKFISVECVKEIGFFDKNLAAKLSEVFENAFC